MDSNADLMSHFKNKVRNIERQNRNGEQPKEIENDRAQSAKT